MVIWTPTAQNDLQNFILNARVGTENTSKKYIKSLVEYTNILNFMPYLGTNKGKISSKFKQNIYQLIFKSHKIFYSISSNNIYILTVIHSKQDLSRVFNNYFNNI